MFSPYDEKVKNSDSDNQPVDLDQIDVVTTVEEKHKIDAISLPHGADQGGYYGYANRHAEQFLLRNSNAPILNGQRGSFLYIRTGITSSIVVAVITLIFLVIGGFGNATRYGGYENDIGYGYPNTGSIIRSTTPTGIFSILGGVGFITSLAVSIGLFVQDRKLLRDGQLLAGMIDSTAATMTKNGLSLKVQYRVQSPTGRTLYASASTMRNDLRIRGFWRSRVDTDRIPRNGTLVHVLYVNDSLFTIL